MKSIDRISISGFKSIAGVRELELRPINILIGANGSGKSNILGAFTLLHELSKGRLQRYVASNQGASAIWHRDSCLGAEWIELKICYDGDRYQYMVQLDRGEADTLYVGSESVIAPDDEMPWYSDIEELSRGRQEAIISEESPAARWSALASLLDGFRVYHFQDTGPNSPLKRQAALHDNRHLRKDGANLAAFLHMLRQRFRDSYQQIVGAVRLVAPFFDDFVLEPLMLDPESIKLEWRHIGINSYFNAAALSDGTLRFMALATLLLQPEELLPSTIIIDEPEIGLHPAAMSLLASIIKSVSHGTQVIASTQSPVLLDFFEPEDILVVEREKGATVVKRLEEGPLSNWLEEYSVGQLWEKNHFGGRPVPEQQGA
jgi:predicted ATPase